MATDSNSGAGSASPGPAAALAERLDSVNRICGALVRWLALAMVLVQFGVVIARYVFGVSSVAASETVLYMHAGLFMLGAGYTLLIDGHVRVDIFYSKLSPRGKAVTDLLGAVFLLAPSLAVIAWWSWPSVRNSWAILEGPISVGGIPASFLLKSLIPAFCLLLAIQGLALFIRNLGIVLQGSRRDA